jgi:hypothetical protein
LPLGRTARVTNATLRARECETQNGVVAMADQKHEHGTMSTEVQEKTFAGFMSLVSKSTVVILVALVLLYLING